MKLNAIQKRQLRLLNETAAFYNSSNRAISGMNCQYITNDGKRCAIGRIISKKLANSFENNDLPYTCPINNSQLFTQLPKKLQVLSKEFLLKLQELHDDPECWSDNGINSKGIEQVQAIKAIFNLI